MKLVVAAECRTPFLWRRASALESPTVVPASTLPALGMAPVRANIASRSVVLPLWKGPTSAMHRGPRGLLTFCPIRRLLVWSSAHDWVGSQCSARAENLASGKTLPPCGAERHNRKHFLLAQRKRGLFTVRAEVPGFP